MSKRIELKLIPQEIITIIKLVLSTLGENFCPCYGLHGLQVLWTSWTMDMESEFLFTNEGVSKLWASAAAKSDGRPKYAGQGLGLCMGGEGKLYYAMLLCPAGEEAPSGSESSSLTPSIHELVIMEFTMRCFRKSWHQFHYWVQGWGALLLLCFDDKSMKVISGSGIPQSCMKMGGSIWRTHIV